MIAIAVQLVEMTVRFVVKLGKSLYVYAIIESQFVFVELLQ